jgi:hypothetical protein
LSVACAKVLRMGASGWDCIEPYSGDLQSAYAAVRERVFLEEHYFWYDSTPRPASLAALDGLLADREPEFDENGGITEEYEFLIDLATTGTHSILDTRSISVADATDITLLTEDEMDYVFGTNRPTRGDFEARDSYRSIEVIGDRWNGGKCVLLYNEAGEAVEVAFWGISGG